MGIHRESPLCANFSNRLQKLQIYMCSRSMFCYLVYSNTFIYLSTENVICISKSLYRFFWIMSLNTKHWLLVHVGLKDEIQRCILDLDILWAEPEIKTPKQSQIIENHTGCLIAILPVGQSICSCLCVCVSSWHGDFPPSFSLSTSISSLPSSHFPSYFISHHHPLSGFTVPPCRLSKAPPSPLFLTNDRGRDTLTGVSWEDVPVSL